MTDIAVTELAPVGAPPRAMSLSASAAKRVRKLAEMEGGPQYMMRLSVSGGGCSGFQYGFSFDAATTDEDHVFERDGARLVVDDTSLDLLAGAEVDFVEELAGSYFKVNNPNAGSSCGCGQSFSL
ncbi:MAG: iron-sulfur cluster insertion protein ErpA [Azospirillaceae bacterium]|nr:iron-sulfur cluster insertion protein ErpA [Azospirillaceae bacterium]